jgi:threonine dehydratase
MSDPIDRDAIAATYRTIRPHVRETPVLRVDGGDFGLEAGAPLALKLEFLQHGGSFKARGAFTNLLTRKLPDVGVAAASGGNHGVAVALAAQRLGVPATIFVPSVASQTKVRQIKNSGARLEVAGDRYADALAACEKHLARSGAMGIHAFEQRETLLGQGTVGLELEAQAPEIDTLLVAVGGGGLIGGIAAWFRGAVRLIGVEPVEAPTLTRALAAGEPVDAPAGGVAADSLAPRRVGSLMFPLAREFVHEVILVEDDEIRRAQRQIWERLRIVSEPGGAAALAALMSGRYRPQPGERVAVLMCGANTDAVNFDAV